MRLERDPVSQVGPRSAECACRELEDTGGATTRQPDTPRLQVRHPVDDHATIVERDLTWLGNAKRVIEAVRALKEAA